MNIAPALSCRQQGVALISVMLIFFLASLIAVAMVTRQQLGIQRTAVLLNQEQAWQYALGAQELVRQALYDTMRASPDLVHAGQGWAMLQAFPVEDGTIAIETEDLQGKFNINSLMVGKGAKDVLPVLLRVAGIDAQAADRITGFLEANGAMQDISELNAPGALTPEEFAALKPFITALPQAQLELNVNTASPAVLEAFIPDEAKREKLLEARNKNGFLTSADLSAAANDITGLTTKSRFFQILANVHYAGRISRLTRVLHYNTQQQFITLSDSLALP